MIRLGAALALVVIAAGCDAAPATTCADPLGGAWSTDDGRRVHVLDRGAAVEVFVVSDDTAPFRAASLPTAHDAVIAAPAVIDLRRHGDALTGTHARRFQRGASTCIVRTPARLHGCRDDRAVLELAPSGPPADWTLCAPPPTTPETWRLRRD